MGGHSPRLYGPLRLWRDSERRTHAITTVHAAATETIAKYPSHSAPLRFADSAAMEATPIMTIQTPAMIRGLDKCMLDEIPRRVFPAMTRQLPIHREMEDSLPKRAVMPSSPKVTQMNGISATKTMRRPTPSGIPGKLTGGHINVHGALPRGPDVLAARRATTGRRRPRTVAPGRLGNAEKGEGAHPRGRAWGTDGAIVRSGYARLPRVLWRSASDFLSPLNNAVMHGSGGYPRPVRPHSSFGVLGRLQIP